MFTAYAALPDGTIRDPLTSAHDLKLTWRLDAPGEASFTLHQDPTDTTPPLVDSLTTDLLVTYNGSSVFGWRGRVGSSGWEIDDTSHSEQWFAVDYRGMLARRYARADLTYTAADTAAVSWALVQHAQAGDSGSFGVGPGALPTVVSQDVEVATGKAIGEQIDDLAGIYPGFDWWVTPDMTFQVDTFRGTQRDFVLEHGSTVSRISRRFESSQYGNTVIQTGADGLTPVTLYADDLDVRPEGRFELVASNPDLTTPSALNASAQSALVRGAASGVSHTFTLTPGVWTPEECWLGDIVPYRYQSAGRNVDALARVVEITVTDTGNGTTSTDITVGSRFTADLAALNRRIVARLNQLARR